MVIDAIVVHYVPDKVKSQNVQRQKPGIRIQMNGNKMFEIGRKIRIFKKLDIIIIGQIQNLGNDV